MLNASAPMRLPPIEVILTPELNKRFEEHLARIHLRSPPLSPDRLLEKRAPSFSNVLKAESSVIPSPPPEYTKKSFDIQGDRLRAKRRASGSRESGKPAFVPLKRPIKRVGREGTCAHCGDRVTPAQWRHVRKTRDRLSDIKYTVCNPCGLHFDNLKRYYLDYNQALLVFEAQRLRGDAKQRGKKFMR